MKKRVLVIDDSPLVYRQIMQILNSEEYEILEYAKDGEEGVELYKKLKPDVVTLDIIMPGIDGLETAEQILAFDKDAKIIMLSSLCDDSTLEEVKKVGAGYLIAKPLDGEVLNNILKLIFA